MKNTLIKTIGLILLFIFSYTNLAEGSRLSRQVDNSAERGMFSARPFDEARLANQVPGLTQEQRDELREIYLNRRAEMNHLNTLYQNERMDREELRERTRLTFETFQNKVKSILDDEQWAVLEELRKTQREGNRSGRQAYHETRMTLAADELNLNQETRTALIAVVRSYQDKMTQTRNELSEPQRRTRVHPETRMNIMKLQLEMQDEVRALIGDDLFVEWRMLTSPTPGQQMRPHRGFNQGRPADGSSRRQPSRPERF